MAYDEDYSIFTVNSAQSSTVRECDVKLLAPFRPLTGRQGFDVERVTCAINSLYS